MVQNHLDHRIAFVRIFWLLSNSVQDIIELYATGHFLMAGDDGRLGWFQSKRHALFPIERPPVFPRSLNRVLRSGRFQMRINADFDSVVKGCAARKETWISDELIRIYTYLHQVGIAHSFEAWEGEQLGGGILGLTIGRAFIGESMFYRIPDASKCALVRLCEHLRWCGFEVFDAQIQNPHLERFGSFEIVRDDYLPLLSQAVSQSPIRNFQDLKPGD